VKKGEWEGRKVRLLVDLTNQGGEVFATGTVMKCTRNYGGLWLEAFYVCPSCASGGRKRQISRVPEHKVELLPPGYEETAEERMKRAGEWAAGKLGVDSVRTAVLEDKVRRLREKIESASRVINDGLKYHEFDGHDMPKRVAREALAVLEGE
jgi:hypothetical protein